MAQPPAYERQYSFRAFQTANPADPLPGQKVDIELNAVKTTVDAILANLALIQRDDGEIANNSVGTSQLDGALISLGFERPAAWVTATAYSVDDAVFQNSKLYLCLVAHTSGTFNTDLSAAKWEEVIDFTTLVTDAEAARDAAQGYAADAQAAEAAAEAAAAAVAGSATTWLGDTSGTNNFTVAPNAYTPAVRADGFNARFRVKTANTGAVNLTVTGYADADVRRADESELENGAWPLNSIQDVTWNATKGWYTWTGDASTSKFARLDTANTLAAALTLSSTLAANGAATFASTAAFNALATFTVAPLIQMTDAGAGIGPNLILDRLSASPLAADVISALTFRGRDSGGTATDYAQIIADILDPTDASEDSDLRFRTIVAGSAGDRLTIGQGLQVGAPSGGDKGSGTINMATRAYAAGLVMPTVLEVQNASSSAEIIFNLSSYTAFTHFEVLGSGIVPATDGVTLNLTTSTDGSTYDVGTSYAQQASGYAAGSAISVLNDGAAAIVINNGTTLGNASGETLSFRLLVFNPLDTGARTTYLLDSFWFNATTANPAVLNGGAGRRAIQDTTHLKFSMSSGNITSGKFVLIGKV